MRTKKIDRNRMQKLFYYDAATGELTWKKGKFTGKVAGATNSLGYIVVDINGSKYYAHRIIAQLHSKKCIRKKVVDHKNYKKDDNRIDNLQVTTQSVNLLRKRSSGRVKVCNYRGIERRVYPWGSKYRAVLAVKGHKMYGSLVSDEKVAYNKYLQLFAAHHGLDKMCPKMLQDYLKIS